MHVVVVSQAATDEGWRVAAAAAADAARRAQADAHVSDMALSDGGAGLIDALATLSDQRRCSEVAGPYGHPLEVVWLLRRDGTAVLEAAAVCGVSAAASAPGADAKEVRLGSSYGLGELLDAARLAGAARIYVGVTGVDVGDAGSGALSGLGFRLAVEDGSGLKIGADELHRLARIDKGWAADWSEVDVTVLVDEHVTLRERLEAADGDVDSQIGRGRSRFVEIVERDLGVAGLTEEAMTGAGSGVAFGLTAGLAADRVDAFSISAELGGLADAVDDADLVVVLTDEAGGASRGYVDTCTAVAAEVSARGGHHVEVEVPRGDPRAISQVVAEAVSHAVACLIPDERRGDR